MTRRRNAAFPPQLRDIETALDWAIKEGGISDSDDFPEGIPGYAGLKAFIEEHEDNLRELEDEDYTTFEKWFEAEKVLRNAEEYLDRMDEYEDAGELELYRALNVPIIQDPDGPPSEDPDLSVLELAGVGIYWSYDEECAEAHWSQGGGTTIILTGVVAVAHIDWEGSFLSYALMGDDECEVRLDEGAPIEIVAIGDEELEPSLWGTA